MTLQEFDHYVYLHNKHREKVNSAEVTLEIIRKALFSFFGIKEPDSPEELEKKIDTMTGNRTVKKEEMDSWYKAGMPSPFDKWLADYRKKVK